MEGILVLWYVQALIISAGASLFLNGAPFLPKLRDIRPRRMQARLVGYMGLFAAFLLWCVLNPDCPAWPDAIGAWGIIAAGTLSVNILIHLYRQDNPRDDGRTIQIGLTDKGRALLEELVQQRTFGDLDLDGLFKQEQFRETSQERWENVMSRSNRLLPLQDEIISCIEQALRTEHPGWLFAALADAQEARQEFCKTQQNIRLWYQLFWPKHAA